MSLHIPDFVSPFLVPCHCKRNVVKRGSPCSISATSFLDNDFSRQSLCIIYIRVVHCFVSPFLGFGFLRRPGKLVPDVFTRLHPCNRTSSFPGVVTMTASYLVVLQIPDINKMPCDCGCSSHSRANQVSPATCALSSLKISIGG